MTNRVSASIVPGSPDKPFNPINPWGRKAPMPQGWVSPLERRPYQVFVDDRHKGRIPIGPKWGMNEAMQLCATTNAAIKAGKISDWSNPHVVACPFEQAVARVF